MTSWTASGCRRTHPQRVLVALLLLLAALLAHTPTAFAQQPDSSMEDMFEAIEFERETGKREPLPSSSVKDINLGVHWQLITRVTDEGKEAATEIRALRDHQLSMGTRNDPAYMLAAIKHIENTHSRGDISTEAAAQSIKATHTLAQDLPHAHLAHARHLLRHAPAKLGQSSKSLITGWKKSLSWQDTSRPLRYNLAIYALLAALCTSLAFIFMQVARYFSVLTYDLVRLLPTGFSSIQSVLAMLAIIIIPGLLLQAPIVSLVILLCAISIVQQPRERIVSIMCFALLAALPTIEATLSPYMTWNVGSSQQLMHAQYLPCDSRCTERWVTRQQDPDGGKDIVLDYTAWLLQYKAGQTAELLENGELTKESVASWPTPLRGQAYNLLGATLIAQNQPERAIEVLEEAEKMIPKSAAPSLNIMRAAQITGDREQARGALARANQKDLEVTLEFLALERRDVNTTLRVDPLPQKVFWQRHLAEERTHIDIIAPVWPLLAGTNVPFDASQWLGLFGLIIALITIPIPLKHKCSTPCPSCGLARSPHDSEKNSNHPYCLSCYESFVMGATMSYNERVASDAMLNSRRKRQSASRRFLSLLLPGSGHILAGYGLAGALMVMVCCMAIIIFLRPQGFWRAPSNLIFADWFGLRVMAGVALFALVGVALWILRQGLMPVRVSTYHYTPPARDEEQGDRP